MTSSAVYFDEWEIICFYHFHALNIINEEGANEEDEEEETNTVRSLHISLNHELAKYIKYSRLPKWFNYRAECQKSTIFGPDMAIALWIDIRSNR